MIPASRRWWTLGAVALLAGCSGAFSEARSGTDLEDVDAGFDSAPPELGGQVPLVVNVFPAGTGGPGAPLPQSFVFDTLEGSPNVDLGLLQLDPSGELEGAIIGFKPNPLISTVPGRDVAVGGTVFVERADTIEQYRVVADPVTGVYRTTVTRPGLYDVTVAPDDPALPLTTIPVEVGETLGVGVGDFDIGLGVPVYGQVTAAGVPVENARVHLVDDLGHESATVRTDEDGRYLIRAAPEQAYSVVCEGVRSLHPVWSRRRLAVENRGVSVDFPYPFELEPRGIATGEIVSDVAGASVGGTQIRLVATRLEGFDELLQAGDQVTWEWEETVDDRGFITVRVAPGDYRVELTPPSLPAGADLAPPELVLSPVTLDVGPLPADIGALTLLPTLQTPGQVTDPFGAGLAEVNIACKEQGFGTRTATAVTDEFGNYEIRVPQGPLSCEFVPPQSENGRALLGNRTLLVNHPTELPDVQVLDEGTLFEGRVTDSLLEPLQFAWVEVRSAQTDALLAYGIADSNGDIHLRGDLPESLDIE